ncbi:MAG: DUF2281 domain-containing protein [Rhodoferax sp.]|nr:DUF2281 domain-containing protein [Rhodoferax sp.]
MTHAELVFVHLQKLPESVGAEVFDFLQFLEQKRSLAEKRQPRQPGSARGQIWTADDFDAPLSDFDEHQ